jgi:hypothetical protein
MKSYNSGDDLRDLGIDLLTGEACGVSMRVLCDLDDNGIELWESFTRSRVIPDSNWNSRGKASVMIPYSMFEDLWIFGQIRNGMHVFKGGYVMDKQWTESHYDIADWEISPRSGGSVWNEDHVETYRHPVKDWRPTAIAIDPFDIDSWTSIMRAIEAGIYHIARTYTLSNQPGTGMDNMHTFTGRIV